MSFSPIYNNSSSITLSSIPSSSSQSYTNYIFSRNPKPSYLSLPRVPSSRSVVSLARRRSNSGRPITSSNKNKSQKKKDPNRGDDLNEDAFEALFKQLEEDLKQDEELLDDGEDEISEEELAMLERELEEALAEDENMSELLNMTENVAVEAVEEEMEDEAVENVVDEDDDEEEEEDDEDEEEPVKLKGWQLRRLAYALKVGRRKTSIKNLATELCLERAVVLDLLRDPPPNLLMLSATLPDKTEPPVTTPDSKDLSSVPAEAIADSPQPEPKVKTPVHVLQGNWSAQKRLKKAHVETLEKVYRRTKRPTNAMISSIVHVTNLPRAKVVKWFEDKRADEGVPEQHRPYRRSSSKSVIAE